MTGSAQAAGPTSRKPADSPFYQQRLKAWQPILTPQWVIITFLVIGIPFIAIGFAIRAASDSVVEYRVQYDGAGADGPVGCRLSSSVSSAACTISIVVEKEMKAPVYVYYELSNFYQNHRRYVKSRSDPQLAGTIFTSESASGMVDCDPLRTAQSGKVLHPCGLVANSYFTDVFTMANAGYPMDETGISWASDRERKFKAVSAADQARLAGQVQFINETYGAFGVNNIDNEHFIVWMRPAALPTFRKLYGKIDRTIPAGTVLSFGVRATYDVNSFEGKKALVLSTVSWMGGKNPFLGIAYIVVGFLAIGMAALFGIRQFFGGRKLGDTSFLVYNVRR